MGFLGLVHAKGFPTPSKTNIFPVKRDELSIGNTSEPNIDFQHSLVFRGVLPMGKPFGQNGIPECFGSFEQ